MSIVSVLTPYKYYAIVAALGCVLLGAAYGGYSYRGIEVSELKLNALVLEQQREEVALSYSNSMQDIATQTEKRNYENQKKHNHELTYYRNLVNQSGGLFDYSESTNSSATAPSSTGTSATPSGARLSEAASSFLLEEANRADQVVSQYLECQKYVQELSNSKEK